MAISAAWLRASGVRPRRSSAAERVQVEDADMQGVPLLQGCPQCAVQPVFEVDVALPLHRMGEQITVKRGVLVEQLVECQLLPSGDQLVETYCAGWDAGPVAGGQSVIRIGAAFAHGLEDQKITCPALPVASRGMRQILLGGAAYPVPT